MRRRAARTILGDDLSAEHCRLAGHDDVPATESKREGHAIADRRRLLARRRPHLEALGPQAQEAGRIGWPLQRLPAEGDHAADALGRITAVGDGMLLQEPIRTRELEIRLEMTFEVIRYRGIDDRRVAHA